MKKDIKARYHLPGLFEFFDFYEAFLELYFSHPEYFYEWCEIGSIYGAPGDCLWGGGRVGFGDADPESVFNLMKKYNISSRLTFSNSLLTEEHLKDRKCNKLCKLFSQSDNNGIIIYSDLLLNYIKENYPGFYFVSSTTKVLTDMNDCISELNRGDFEYVVPDFRLNHAITQLSKLTEVQKNKVEFLCNECCSFTCKDRKACYEEVSRKSLGLESSCHSCTSKEASEGYLFSKAMKNPGFISRSDIQNTFLPLGFSNFKIEGRSLGSAILLEFILYYMTKPEYHLIVREKLYLDSTLDLF